MKKLALTLLCLSQATLVQALPLPSHPITSYTCDNCASLSHETVSYFWAVKDQQYSHLANNARQSNRYHFRVSGRDLQQGVTIHTLARAAVISIRPIGKAPLPSLELGRDAQSLQPLVKQSQENGLIPETSDPIMVYQLAETTGKGAFILKSRDQQLTNQQAYLIQVYDKFSNIYMTLSTDKSRYELGDWVKTTLTMTDIDDNYPTTSIKAMLLSPQGETTPIELTRVKNKTWEGRTQLTTETNAQGKNWIVQAQISGWAGDEKVTRTGHTAFSYDLPSATFSAIHRDDQDKDAVNIEVKNATASRYGLQAVLFQKDDQGVLHPLYTSQTASWLEPGTHSLSLHFPQGVLDQQGNLYMGYLHLTDYGQVNTVDDYDKPIALRKLE